MNESHFNIVEINQAVVAIEDLDIGGRSVNNDAENVLKRLDALVPGGIRHHYVYYKDSAGDWARLEHRFGRFSGFAPLTVWEQAHFDKVDNMEVISNRFVSVV